MNNNFSESGSESVGATPSSERDFVESPATEGELNEWTEQYRVAPDLSSVEGDLFEGPEVPAGQELVPTKETETLLEVTPSDDDVEDETLPEVAEPETSEDAFEEEDIATGVEEEAEETPDSTYQAESNEHLSPIHRGVSFVAEVAPSSSYEVVETHKSGTLESLLALLRKARATGDSIQIASLERQIAELRAKEAQADTKDEGNGSPIDEGAETIEGEYIPKSEVEMDEQLKLEHDDVPALEHKPNVLPDLRGSAGGSGVGGGTTS